MNKYEVLLAISGGIDSAVSIHLLQELGYAVSCIHFRFWHWERDRSERSNDAVRTIAERFGVPLEVINHEEAFHEKVITGFLEEQKAGRTPNPCVFCNPNVKFALLKEFADARNIRHIATGHYAQIDYDKKNDRYLLKSALDELKDQSYMLCYLDQATLARTVFPLGNYRKIETYEIGKKLGLPIREDEESQDLCFVKPENYQSLLREAVGDLEPGNIVNTAGEIIGKHEGLVLYTIGQRKGIKVSAQRPFYVIKKDIETNSLVVGHSDELGNMQFEMIEPNWIWTDIGFPFEAKVKIRYRSEPIDAMVEMISKDRYKISLKKMLPGITPGQYAVFYRDDYVIGGGKIIG